MFYTAKMVYNFLIILEKKKLYTCEDEACINNWIYIKQLLL